MHFLDFRIWAHCCPSDISAHVAGAVTLQLVDKDNQDVCRLSAIDPCPNCGLVYRNMLKDAATMSWLGLVKQVLPSRDSCWLAKVPMLQSRV